MLNSSSVMEARGVDVDRVAFSIDFLTISKGITEQTCNLTKPTYYQLSPRALAAVHWERDG